jgi:hypothetical protein
MGTLLGLGAVAYECFPVFVGSLVVVVLVLMWFVIREDFRGSQSPD